MNHPSPEAEPIRPLVEELTPAPDPWQVCLRLSSLPRLLFLDSASRSAALGRYSFVTADPYDMLWAVGGQSDDPFAMLRKRLQRPTKTLVGLPPFQGGAAGLFGYGLCHHIERLPWRAGEKYRTLRHGHRPLRLGRRLRPCPGAGVGHFHWLAGTQFGQAISPGRDAPRRCQTVTYG